jgi:hypothetical protein
MDGYITLIFVVVLFFAFRFLVCVWRWMDDLRNVRLLFGLESPLLFSESLSVRERERERVCDLVLNSVLW